MPSGDAQRTWFPEMIVRLRSEWYQGMSMPALIRLRDELDGMLQRIRTVGESSAILSRFEAPAQSWGSIPIRSFTAD
jgi:hypothetical protein